jgi:hypothetical protein
MCVSLAKQPSQESSGNAPGQSSCDATPDPAMLYCRHVAEKARHAVEQAAKAHARRFFGISATTVRGSGKSTGSDGCGMPCCFISRRMRRNVAATSVFAALT